MTIRQTTGAQILAEPGRYVVCECCGSIVVATVKRACPACNGYRFDRSAERVIAQARVLMGRAARSVTGEDLR